MSLETEVASLTTATTNLLNAVMTSKGTLDQAVADAAAQVVLAQGKVDLAADQVVLAQGKVDLAAAQVAIAEGYATTANTHANNAQTSAQTAQTAVNNAVAVVTGGTASLTPSAGKIPIADATGQIDAGWVNPLPAVAATLHRSPNAIMALFVYDTSKDSDGGAWTDKCQHTSWYQETIYGKWLGAQASESAARAVSGAVTGDYFQLTTDGKFYSLSAGSGTTEVFRGNKRSFPKLAAIVASAANVDVYDLTESSRPMWARYPNTGAMATGNIAALAAVNGQIFVGGASGLATLNFATDRLMLRNATNLSAQAGLATIRTSARSVEVGTALTNAAIADLAVTVTSDAPTHPATGLRVPTVALATGARVVVIRNDGTLVNSSSTSAFTAVTLTPQLLSAGRADAVWYYAANPNALGASFTLSTKNASTATDFNVGNTTLLKAKDRANLARSSSSTVQLLRNNEGAIGKGIAAKLSSYFNSGWLAGDIRRAYLASFEARSITPSELMVNGDFSNGTTGWSVSGTGASMAVANGELALTMGTATTYAYKYITTTIGRGYRVTVKARAGTGTAYVRVGVSGYNAQYGEAQQPSTTTTTLTFYLVAASTDLYINLCFSGGGAGQIAYYDDVSIVEVIPNRSYINIGAPITGTLTATAVNTSADLVAYSGFSAANYIQEPYHADLDFGTGEWSASAWVSIPTDNVAAGTIACREHSSGAYIRLGIDATNKLTATAHDGTTTRTVTTASAYNTATWLKARVNYTTDGKLAISVNGVEVAATTGAALLTLNNSNAVLTLGNSYALDAPFLGSICLVKLSATVPTAEQALFMYEQEKQMFAAGAKCVLPASTSVLDLAYDDETDTWSTLQATHESTWSGLVRTGMQTPSAGSFSRCAAGSANKLLARTTTNPGVDIQMPSRSLRAELRRRREALSAIRDLITLDYFGGLTATTTLNSTSLTNVASSLIPSTTSLIGCAISGTGIPASTFITGVSGTTIYMSKAATANGSSIQISTTDFNLPVGYTARAVLTAGTLKREGSTADFTRLHDGFRETIRFAVAPGYNAWVQIQAVKEVPL